MAVVAAESFGLPWSTGRVSAFERGDVSPTLPTLYAYARALSAASGEPVTLADLLDGDGDVTINDDVVTPLSKLRGAVSGQPVMGLGEATILGGRFVGSTKKLSETDIRICKSIGVEPNAGLAAMVELWGHTFSTERDRRSEPGDNAQRRGQISRQLKADLLSLIHGEEAK